MKSVNYRRWVDPRYRDLSELYEDEITRTRHFNSAENGVYVIGKARTSFSEDDAPGTKAA